MNTLLQRTLLLACAGALALPAGSLAAKDAEVSIMDDQLLLGSTPTQVNQAMDQFSSLGVDRLRVSAFWGSHAPSPASKVKPAFNAANPNDPAYNWVELDRVVQAAVARNIKLMISITTPAPIWGTGDPKRNNRVYKPKPTEFALFAQAVAARYGPFVDQYGLLNEPNQGAWLQPQAQRKTRRRPAKLIAPHLYRGLARAIYPAIKRGDAGSNVLVGELAPSGRKDPGPTRPIRPLLFLREMGCVDKRFRRIRKESCRNFKPVTADSIGHHPYAFFLEPQQKSKERDDAAIGDGRRLLKTIDRLTAKRVLRTGRPGRLDVHYTEYGYQTDPPDRFAGVALDLQSRYLQEAAFIAWKTPRVRTINQFRLTDGAIDRKAGYKGFNEFQSGLIFRSGKPKPSLGTFATPMTIAGRSKIWGQIRPGGIHNAVLERVAGNGFIEISKFRTDVLGYFQVNTRLRAGRYRLRYDGPGGEIVATTPEFLGP
ncbi:MAG: cellulase family glycosylhydrolase [Thermoleophilaceae bacterium]|nr:cellulase family glycosylhydrolase [Thermoleophilaceae bacterium]